MAELEAQEADESRIASFLNPDDPAFFFNTCVPMYQAAIKGDWRAARIIIDGCNAIVRSSITITLETPLHKASSANRVAFVRNLLERMQRNDLALRNNYGLTALIFAAQAGAIKIVQMMIARNPDLVHIPGNNGQLPLLSAIIFGHRETVSFLFERTNFDLLNNGMLEKIFHNLICSNLFDFALRLLEGREALALSRDSKNRTALHLMALKPYAISPNRMFMKLFNGGRMSSSARELIERLWSQFVMDPNLLTLLRQPTNFAFDAAAVGNAEFITIIISRYPDIIWMLNDNNQTIFHIAAANRHESVFGLIFGLPAKSSIVELVDNTGCNILHHTARLPPYARLQVVSGAAFQMQRELLWFEVVKNIVTPASLESMTSEDNRTPDVIFTEEHQTLRKEGEKWLKGTSTTCLIVATLIATLVFAAGTNIPGGFHSNGTPILMHITWFELFYGGAAVAFFCSSLSIVLFTSILTSRSSSQELQTMLPFTLMLGLLMLFISILSMVASFCGAVVITHHSKIEFKLSTVVCLVILTGISFIAFHLNLLIGMIRATYWSKFFLDPPRRRLLV